MNWKRVMAISVCALLVMRAIWGNWPTSGQEWLFMLLYFALYLGPSILAIVGALWLLRGLTKVFSAAERVAQEPLRPMHVASAQSARETIYPDLNANRLEQLTRLKVLLDSNAITEVEYDRLKADVLAVNVHSNG